MDEGLSKWGIPQEAIWSIEPKKWSVGMDWGLTFTTRTEPELARERAPGPIHEEQKPQAD